MLCRMGAVVLTFIGYKRTDRPAKYKHRLLAKENLWFTSPPVYFYYLEEKRAINLSIATEGDLILKKNRSLYLNNSAPPLGRRVSQVHKNPKVVNI